MSGVECTNEYDAVPDLEARDAGNVSSVGEDIFGHKTTSGVECTNEYDTYPDSEAHGGDISPQIGLPCDRLPDLSWKKGRRKQSKSILDIHGIAKDEPDAGPTDTENSNSKVVNYFNYKMDHKDRGVFVIFNHKKFSMNAMPERNGTDIDKENLFETARELGFTVFTHDNLTVKNLKKSIDQYANIDYSDCDCFVCAILTHGEAGDRLYAYDGKYPAKEVLAPFQQCTSLIGKPKLFFIQACRGTDLDDGCKTHDQVDAAGFSGYYAWRNGENGSWFVQALCFCLKKYGNSMELMQIMTRVNRMVAYDFESNVSNPLYHKKKQMPSIVTRLTGDIYFCSSENPMDCETIDGILKRAERLESNKKKEPSGQTGFLKKQLLKTKLDLVKISRKKAEIELKEQDLLEKLLECKLGAL